MVFSYFRVARLTPLRQTSFEAVTIAVFGPLLTVSVRICSPLALDKLSLLLFSLGGKRFGYQPGAFWRCQFPNNSALRLVYPWRLASKLRLHDIIEILYICVSSARAIVDVVFEPIGCQFSLSVQFVGNDGMRFFRR